MDILFKNARVITADASAPYIENAYVGITDGKISYVSETAPEENAKRCIDAKKNVLMPGLYNCHTHLPMTAFRGLSDDCDLNTWLFGNILPAEKKLTPKTVAAASDVALAEMISNGTVSVSDGYFFESTIAERAAKSGIKANLARSVSGDVKNAESLKKVNEMLSLYEQFNMYDNGRIKIDASIHAEYTTSPEYRTYVADIAKSKGMLLQIHVSETESEVKNCIEKYGKSPIALFESEGLFEGTYPLLAHCCHITDEDAGILKRANASVAHCPVSNLKLASGISPVKKLMASGVNICLGTDGAASNNSCDMFFEMKLFAILHKAAERDPEFITAYDAVIAATANGARAERREGCGMIKLGYDADIIMLDFNRPHLTPCINAVSNAVYSARGSDVKMTMVNGKILYENGEFKTIDIERAMSEINSAAFA